MRIGIDARFYKELGIGRYIRNLINCLQRLDDKNEYYIFLLNEDLDKFDLKSNFKKIGVNFKWYSVNEQIKYPGVLKKYNLDLVHFPHFNVPLMYRDRFVVTIHDLIHNHFQTKEVSSKGLLSYSIKKFGYWSVLNHAVKSSSAIITVSNYSKQQIVKELNVDSSKVLVTYEGVDDSILRFSKNISKFDILTILNKYQINSPFLFYVGSAHPHKNIQGLIEVFLLLQKDFPELKLVLSGKENFFWNKIKSLTNSKNIIFTGEISDKVLVAFYKSASLYVFPSFEEGFGIPLIEALACGCPVVSSSLSSLPEIGGDCCVYFDPYDKVDMLEKIKGTYQDSKLRSALIKKGLDKVLEFSWMNLAKQTLEIYRR